VRQPAKEQGETRASRGASGPSTPLHQRPLRPRPIAPTELQPRLPARHAAPAPAGAATQQAAVAMERASTRGERAAAWWLARSSSRSLRGNQHSQREIQEIIRAVFAAHPSRAFPTKDLCDILYPDQPTRAHVGKTSHAARKIVAADAHWTCEFSADGVRSYSSTVPTRVAWPSQKRCWLRSQSGRGCAAPEATQRRSAWRPGDPVSTRGSGPPPHERRPDRRTSNQGR
jgi:hypothetical protein